MKVWVLQDRSVLRTGYWTGDSLKFTTAIERAVWFVRRVDAERALSGWTLIDAKPVEMALPDVDEPRAQSENRDDAVAVNTNQGP